MFYGFLKCCLLLNKTKQNPGKPIYFSLSFPCFFTLECGGAHLKGKSCLQAGWEGKTRKEEEEESSEGCNQILTQHIKTSSKQKDCFAKHQGFTGNHPSWSHKAVSGARPAPGRLPVLSTVGLAEHPELACNPTCPPKPSRPGSSFLWGSSDLPHLSPHPGLAWEYLIHSRSFSCKASLALRTLYTNLSRAARSGSWETAANDPKRGDLWCF